MAGMVQIVRVAYRLLFLVLTVAGMVSCNSTPTKPRTADSVQFESARARDRSDGIRDAITNGTLSDSDRNYLLKAVRSESMVIRHKAVLLLEMAVEKSLFQQNELRLILLEMVTGATGTEAMIGLSHYRNLIEIPPPKGSSFLDPDNFNAHVIGLTEQKRITAALADPSESNRIRAAGILVSKGRLEPASLIYARSCIESELKRSSKKGKDLWTFVKDCIEAKN